MARSVVKYVEKGTIKKKIGMGAIERPKLDKAPKMRCDMCCSLGSVEENAS